MKNILIVIGIAILLVGTYFFIDSRTEELPEEISYITGNVYDLNDNRLLVAEGFEGDYDGDIDNFIGNAGWFTINEETKIIDLEENQLNFNQINIGNLVEVWVSGPIMESYPVQGTASKIVVIEENEESEEIVYSCYVGGCGGELCTNDPNAISTCELLPGMECLEKEMTCEFIEGECRWVLSQEAAECFLLVKEEQGEEVSQTRIGNLFRKAEELLEI